jgi:hypothetical protein
MSYHGVVELEPSDPRVTGKLPDGRPIGAASADVHAAAGMTCIDCHTERELMGDGKRHQHANEALEIACADCHRPAADPARADADRERVARVLRRAWESRGRAPLPADPPLVTRTGTPLWRTDATTRTLVLAATGERRAIPVAKDAPYHALAGHERLSCQACHTAWAPRCTQCHTRFDPAGEDVDHPSGKPTPGRWIEEAGGNGYGAPLLAIGPRGQIGTFVEGMRLRVDGVGDRPIERTLWAPLDPHTTGRARGCASCHAPATPDDVTPTSGETTRSNARLLGDEERARIARVGTCIGCHAAYDDAIYGDFAASVGRLARFRAGDRAAEPDPARLARCRGPAAAASP